MANHSIPANAALLIPRDEVAGASDSVKLDASRQTSLQLESAPDLPATASTVAVNLWASDSARAESRKIFRLHDPAQRCGREPEQRRVLSGGGHHG